MMVTLLTWMAHNIVPSKSHPIRYTSEASCAAANAVAV
jgi:hypothetical protein